MPPEHAQVTKLVNEIKTILRNRGITRSTFAGELNTYLPTRQREAVNKSRLTQISRWLSLQVIPSAETTLAMKAWLDKQHENTPKKK